MELPVTDRPHSRSIPAIALCQTTHFVLKTCGEHCIHTVFDPMLKLSLVDSNTYHVHMCRQRTLLGHSAASTQIGHEASWIHPIRNSELLLLASLCSY